MSPTLLLAGLLSAAWAAEPACAELSGSIEDALREGLEAYGRLDQEGVLAASQALDARLACHPYALPAVLVPDVHLLKAMVALYGEPRQPERALAAARAFAAVEPDAAELVYRYGVDRGELLWRTDEQARDSLSQVSQAPLPSGQWLVDGLPASTLPVGRAAVLQRADCDGGLRTWYVWGEDSLPPEEAMSCYTPPAPPPRRGRGLAWGVAGLGAVALGANVATFTAGTSMGCAPRGPEPEACGALRPMNYASAGVAVGAAMGVGVYAFRERRRDAEEGAP